MKKAWFVLPLAATAGAIAANLRGFLWGGSREWWELAVSVLYLFVWAVFLARCSVRWQRITGIIWWTAAAICCAVCFLVVTFDLGAFLLIFPAMGLVTPLSGLAVLIGTNYSLFYGLCTILATGYALYAARSTSAITGKEWRI